MSGAQRRARQLAGDPSTPPSGTRHEPEASFDPRAYWEDRLSRRYALAGVGYMGLPESFNAWMYQVRRRVFLREVQRLIPPSEDLRVLDIGSGTGFFVDRWHEAGVRHVTGSDLTDVAVENLRRSRPGDRFQLFDVGGRDHPFGAERFAAISMIDVLYHIVEDDRFARAITHAFELLEPGGVLVFTENFVHGPPVAIRHQVSRSLEEIEAAVNRAGFEILRRRPVFWLMNAPVDSRSRLHRRWWKVVLRFASRPRGGGAIGALLYPFELALVSLLREGPSNEMMVCRRPSSRPVERHP